MLLNNDQELREFHGGIPFLHEVAERKERWAKFFDPRKHNEEKEQVAVDLMKDPVLEHYNVPVEERELRRWGTEYVLDVMVEEAKSHQGGLGILQEATSTSSFSSHITWQLPLIRKIWPRLFLWNITSFQPMSQPAGKYFTLDFQYGTSGGSYAANTSIYASEDPSYSNDLGEAVEPRELNLAITSGNVTASSKKLKGLWSIEAQQDLMAYHKLSIEPEIVKMLGQQIEREINRTCINSLVSGASSQTHWQASQPASPNAWSNATPRQYDEDLWDAIEDANKLVKDAIYEDANFILCGTTFGARLRKLNGFRMTWNKSDALATKITAGPNQYGTLNDRYVIYEDPYFTADRALIGHKGANWMYTGSVFSSYIPVYTTPTIHNTKMQPGRGYLSRYAFTVTNGDFYGTVTII